jgi:1-deoxy-D-xylulose-5-phosphate reductoisomerase
MNLLDHDLARRAASTRDASPIKRVSVLGATGSIGENTLDLIGRHPSLYEVVALTGGCKVARLAELAKTHRAKLAVIADESLYGELCERLSGTGIQAAAGRAAVIEAASRPADWVMAAIVGIAGLEPTLAALRQGHAVAIANKECLVSAGRLFMNEVESHAATLLPVDSEHSAAFQIMAVGHVQPVEKLCLTASGGPFRGLSLAEMADVSPEQALNHPNWSMGPKVTLDSATLMNKALEMLEAHHLFGLPASCIEAVIHPQSIVHCLVYYRDGTVLAHMSRPDMRTPIAYSLAWPERMQVPMPPLDLVGLGRLTFEPPDEKRFPALRLARQVLAAGGSAGTVFNAANEVAGQAFFAGKIGFLAITETVEAVLDRSDDLIGQAPATIDGIIAVDGETRRRAAAVVSAVAPRGETQIRPTKS